MCPLTFARSAEASTLATMPTTAPVESRSTSSHVMLTPAPRRPTCLPGAKPKNFGSSTSRKSSASMKMVDVRWSSRDPSVSSLGWFAITKRLPFSGRPRPSFTLMGLRTAKRRGALASSSWRANCSRSSTRAVMRERVTPMASQKRLITAALRPRLRMPSSVTRRGSSQPETYPKVTRCLSLRFDMSECVRLSREYSHVAGLYSASRSSSQ
mmetsp:Transcript_56961/g.123795  ORF Transcript_56961/g.123795 Transcript_56961/m.123795 type:complete len:211 (-) Transcript_56961:337-969(-)